MNDVYVGATLIGLAVMSAVLTVGLSTSSPTGVAKSLALIDQTPDARSVVKSEMATKDRLLVPLLNFTRRLAIGLSPSGTSERLTRTLDRAGNPAGWTVERLYGVKGAALVLGIAVGFLYTGLTVGGILITLGAGAAMFFLPDLLLYNVALKRQEEVSKGLADALDMLTVCVEAGQGFDAALSQVSRNVEGPISGEFARVISEIQIGKSRGEAFSAMGERMTLAEVRNFTTALVQADRLGLPIGGVLREQSANMRLVRRQKAEEKAQKVAVKIMIPLVLCILPVMFIVVIGPGAVNIARTFMEM